MTLTVTLRENAVGPPIWLSTGRFAAGVVRLGLWRVFYDPVVAAAGSRAACVGAVAAEHLRGGPAVQLHQVALGPAVVEPGMAEVMPTGAGTRRCRTGAAAAMTW
jgi:hypothetical protein